MENLDSLYFLSASFRPCLYSYLIYYESSNTDNEIEIFLLIYLHKSIICVNFLLENTFPTMTNDLFTTLFFQRPIFKRSSIDVSVPVKPARFEYVNMSKCYFQKWNRYVLGCQNYFFMMYLGNFGKKSRKSSKTSWFSVRMERRGFKFCRKSNYWSNIAFNRLVMTERTQEHHDLIHGACVLITHSYLSGRHHHRRKWNWRTALAYIPIHMDHFTY